MKAKNGLTKYVCSTCKYSLNKHAIPNGKGWPTVNCLSTVHRKFAHKNYWPEEPMPKGQWASFVEKGIADSGYPCRWWKSK